ncbi:MAG: hypothetical protein J4G09_00750 [Proteobacteria bacterium]|nr:hypothetical protein [Pseudomonadota bacterium]
MKRIGSNLRPADQKPQRNLTNIIVYSEDEKPRNDYPEKIISPALPKSCCTDENRELVGNTKEVDGFKFCYKICQVCGHAVRYFYPAVETNDEAVREYRAWKRYMAQ